MTSDFLANALLDHVFGSVDYVPPVNIKFHLFTVMPLPDGTGGTEYSGNNYAAVTKANSPATFSAAALRQKTNLVEILFPVPSADWTDLAGLVVTDADSAAFLMSGEFAAPVTAPAGEPFALPIGQVTFSITE